MCNEKEEAVRAEKQTGIFWHWQNLKRDEPGSKQWLWGRAWLVKWPRGRISVEWVVPSHFHISLVVGGNHQIDLTLSLLLFALYLSFDEWTWLGRFPPMRASKGKEIGLDWNSWTLSWNLWTPEDEWSAKTPKWRDGHFDVLDFFGGKNTYRKVDQEPIPVLIPMPEKEYKGTVTFFTQTWKRPRWPWPRVRAGATVDIEGGIPIPGKGENAWDCDEDAHLSIGTCARSVEEAVQDAIEAVNKRRLRYGGPDWRPEPQ